MSDATPNSSSASLKAIVERLETELRLTKDRLQTFANLVTDLLWSCDAGGNVTWFNQRWLDYTGQELGEAVDSGLFEVVHPNEREQFAAAFRNAIDSGAPLGSEYRLRRADGRYRWFRLRAEPVREGGQPTQWLGSSDDIEERRRPLGNVNEDETQGRLLSELQHRVRNTLSVVRSIARRTAESTQSVEDFAAHLDGRLAAFSRVQAIVTRDPAAGVSLEQVVGEEVAALTAREGEQVTIAGPYLRLKPKAAEITALAVHELATNALKYGALSVSDGRIEIGWSILDELEKLRFTWIETVPRGIAPPTRDGFGTEFIKRLVSYELDADAELKFGPKGVSCRIDVPLAIAIAPESKRARSDETA